VDPAVGPSDRWPMPVGRLQAAPHQRAQPIQK
jgi:hypothetical protein